MYCKKCGIPSDPSLNYCKSCGTKFKKEEDPVRSLLSSLFSALITVVVVGLGILVALMAILLDKVQTVEPVFIFALIYLGILFAICFLIIRQISKLIDRKIMSNEAAEVHETQPAVQLPPRTTAQLEQFHEPASVTEHTTRTLQKEPIERL
jgi:F0F1-type ATP synthase assembly protein I